MAGQTGPKLAINLRFASGTGGCIAPLAMQRNSKSSSPSAKHGPIVLVGMMGVGKSTVGRRLATRLGLAFVDADEEIEKAAGMTIAEMFDRYGEGHFRDGERRVIARLMDGAPKVIATGGGAFMQDDTRTLILAQAIAIWLDADIDILVDRVSRREGRPLLKDRDPRAVLMELSEQRNPIYALAPIHVKSVAAPHETAVERILEALKTWQA
jgi:shikimate kinase